MGVRLRKLCPHCHQHGARVQTSRRIGTTQVRYYVCRLCGGRSKSTMRIATESDLSPIQGPTKKTRDEVTD